MRLLSSGRSFAAFLLAALAAVPAGCSSDKSGNDVTCGPGTVLQDHVCQTSSSSSGAIPDGSVGDGAPAQVDGSMADGPVYLPFGGVTSVAPASSTALQVTWNAWSDATTPANLVVYHVYASTAGGQENFSTPVATTPPGATSIVLDNLQTGVPYYVVVRAVNSAGVEDTNRYEKSATTQSDTMAPMFNGATTLTTGSESSIILSWMPATDDLTPPAGITYYVYLSLTSGGENFSAPSFVSDVGATSIDVTALPQANTKYYAVVRARDAAGNIDTNSNEVSGTSGTDTTPPVFAGCTTATVADAASVTLSWPAATDDTTPQSLIAYDVFTSKVPGGEDYTTPAATFTGATVGLVDNLDPGTLYYFVCRARDLSGNEDTNTSERFATTLVDSVPPTFGGVTATANVTASTVQLTWATPGSDNETPQSELVYVVYSATTSGGENFSGTPVAVSAPGASSVTVTGLAPETTYYFVVRARDRGKNTDSNTKEAVATTTVSFQQNVVAIFAQHCAIQGCHVAGNPPPPCSGMILEPGFAYSYTVNVPACETLQPDGGDMYDRIYPGNPSLSLLYLKITATPSNPPPGGGQSMPFPTSNDHLSANDIQIIHDWIQEGALQN